MAHIQPTVCFPSSAWGREKKKAEKPCSANSAEVLHSLCMGRALGQRVVTAHFRAYNVLVGSTTCTLPLLARKTQAALIGIKTMPSPKTKPRTGTRSPSDGEKCLVICARDLLQIRMTSKRLAANAADCLVNLSHTGVICYRSITLSKWGVRFLTLHSHQHASNRGMG